MINPIRIGGLGLMISNLCYWRELQGGKILLYFPGVPLTLEGEEGAIAARYLKRHSPDLMDTSLRAEPVLPFPSKFEPTKTTLFLDREGGA